MRIKSYPKVNLFLLIDKKDKRKNLHKIKSLFYLVDNYYDEIEIKESSETVVRYFIENKQINIDDCILKKTINLLKKKKILNENNFFEINVYKKIPLFSGLGMGSSNASALINYLISQKIIKNNKKLKKVILEIGSDLMFFLKNKKIAFVYGYGEKVLGFRKHNLKINLFFNDLVCSTKEVFNNFQKKEKHSFLKQIFYFKIKQYDFLINELDKVSFKLYPELKKIKENLNKKENKKVFLSGSGSTLFTIG